MTLAFALEFKFAAALVMSDLPSVPRTVRPWKTTGRFDGCRDRQTAHVRHAGDDTQWAASLPYDGPRSWPLNGGATLAGPMTPPTPVPSAKKIEIATARISRQ